MHISHHDGVYRVSLITGPTHNTLFLEFASKGSETIPTVEELPPIGTCEHGDLPAPAVLNAVLAGVAQANHELNTDYRVHRVQFVSNDTPRVNIYSVLAHKLIVHIEQGSQPHNDSSR
jgi:hypothetical protein